MSRALLAAAVVMILVAPVGCLLDSQGTIPGDTPPDGDGDTDSESGTCDFIDTDTETVGNSDSAIDTVVATTAYNKFKGLGAQLVIGAAASSVSTKIAELTRVDHIVQISYASTAASFIFWVICFALTSKAPLKINGNPRTLFTWFG